MIDKRYMAQSDRETRLFITFVMLVCADAFDAFLGDMVGQRKTVESSQARRAAFIVLRRFVCQYRHNLKVKFRVSFDGFGEFEIPISSPNIGYLFNVDHSSFMHPLKFDIPEGKILAICANVVALWPAVKTMGLLPAIMLNKSHAMATANMFNGSAEPDITQESDNASV